jgi:hypothetical protein
VLGVLSLLLVSAPYTVAAAYEQPTLNFPSALEALQEPDWAKASTHDRVFRFIWFPVLTTQRLICVRAEWSASGPRAVAKAVRWDIAAMRQERWAGRLVVNRQRGITGAQWEALAQSRQRGFWRFHPEPYPRSDLVDGTEWVLQARVGGEYLSIAQHAPRDTPFRQACIKMLEVSGLELTEQEWETFYGDGVEPLR